MDRQEKIKKIGEIYHKLTQLEFEYMKLWYENTIFNWDWWVSLTISIIPWLLWIRARHKPSTSRLLYAGFLVLILSSWLDFLGSEMGLWYYTGILIPTFPEYIPWDFCIFPVLAMLLIQYKRALHPLWRAAIYAGSIAFIGEPLAMWAKLYIPLKWNTIYSFPIYFIIYLLAHWLAHRQSFEPLPAKDETR